MRGALLGMSIGDGYIRVNGNSALLRVEHSTAQEEYAHAKRKRLLELIGGRGEMQYRERFDKRTGKIYKSCSFAFGNNKFRIIHGYLYYEGKQIYRRSMLDMLTPEGIAYWYQDDGYAKAVKNKNTGNIGSVYSVLNTYCSEIDARCICDYFSETWNIHPRVINMIKDMWCVKFNTSESKKLAALVMDFIHPSMSYKVAHVQSKLFQECLRVEGKGNTQSKI